MFKDKEIITEDEQILISRYPEDLQEKLKEHLLKDKEYMSSLSYDGLVKAIEQGRKISYSKQENGGVVWSIGELNFPKFARLLIQFSEDTKYKPLKEELEWDDRLEEFKQYPKGTRVEAHGEVAY
ncbi:hypothetical protein [Bacillus altitudinis]|uniref:hypothetical protein n=1 Tax=Bacillus altitudinis TaxID=293387 RepID=UPI0020D0067E|nr:hypothetical protein [Bacillus altitudinis]